MKRAEGPIRWAMAVVCVLVLAACGDDGGSMTEPTPDPPPAEPEPKVATVEITPENVALSSVGSSAELTSVAKDEDGQVMEGVRFVWQSSDPTVVVVDSVGRVVSRGSGSAVVTAVAGGMPGHVPVTVTQSAAALAFRIHPTDAVAGVALSPAIQVEIRDEAGQRVKGATDAVTLLLVGGGEGDELRGTRTVNAVDGVASFSGLAVERAGSGFKVLASAGELESAESEAFAIEPGAPAGLAFLNEPEEVVAGDTFTVRVEVRDAWGNPVPTATGRVALSLAAAPEDAGLGGVLEADVVEGLADFGPVLERADSAYVLAVAGSGLEGAKSGRFRVVPAAPKQLAFIDLPDSIYAGEEHTYRVGVVDAFGNRVLGVDSVRVTIESDTLMMVDGEVAYTHTILSARNGTLFATAPDEGWGTARAEPVMILNWREIVSGHDRACGISTYSVLLCWGNSTRGRLGTGGGSQSIPVHVVGNRRWRSVAVGRDHTCAVAVGGTAYCWGGNAYGQLGINDPSVEHVTEPTKVDTDLRFSEITAGQYHTCAVTTVTNRVLCWGRNDLDQLGSAGGDAYAPRPVDSDLEFRRIAAGWNHTCALRGPSAIGGHVYCWGDNAHGQLGNQSRTRAVAPDSVITNRKFMRIAAGSRHTCGIDESTTGHVVVCWGSNAQGQLGHGPEVTMDSVPREVSRPRFEAREVTAGENHTCIVTWQQRQPYCWGANTSGQLGTGDSDDRSYPTLVVGAPSFDVISAGPLHTCATSSTEGAYCWGSNRNGRLGIGAVTDVVSYIPRRVRTGG